MRFMLSCLVLVVLLVAAAPSNPFALLAAAGIAALGLLEFGMYAVREARKAQRRQQAVLDSQMDAMEWDWYWQAQEERRIHANHDRSTWEDA